VSSTGGTVAQLTFGTAAASHPVPSPDGRQIVFGRLGGLWVMPPNGRTVRLVAVNSQDPAWSPDSRTIAYASVDVRGGRHGIRVVGADARGDHLLIAGDAAAPAWSPDGRSLAFVRRQNAIVVVRGGREQVVAAGGDLLSPLVWSVDGRWLAYTAKPAGPGVISLVRADGRRHRIVDEGWKPAWSPGGRLIAYVHDQEVRVVDLETGARRTLVSDSRGVTSLAWSPAGDAIAYITYGAEFGTSIGTVSLSGHVQSPTSFPDAGEIAWTAPPPGLRYRAPVSLDPVAAGNELRLRAPVGDLAADGGKIAYRACGSIGVWRAGTAEVTPVRVDAPLCAPKYRGFNNLTLAGDVVGYGTDEGGNAQVVALQLSTVGDARAVTTVSGFNGTRGNPLGVGFLLGKGPLVVFSTWASGCNFPGMQCPDPAGPQPLWRVPLPLAGACLGTGSELGPPCRRIADGPVAPLAVDGGRVVVSRPDGSLVLLDGEGRELLSLPFAPGAVLGAELAGGDLVVLVQAELRDYDPTTGALLHAWPLPDVPSGGFCGTELWRCGRPRLVLEDATRGLALYLLDGHVHLLRLSDGADAVVVDGSVAQLEDAGLFYAYERAGDAWPGRIRFVPFDELPLR